MVKLLPFCSRVNLNRTEYASLDVETILNVGGFHLDRALEVDTKFLEPEYPFAWAGIYDLAAGTYQLMLQTGPDPAMNMALFLINAATTEALDLITMDAVIRFSEESSASTDRQTIQASNAALQTLHLHDRPATFPIQITRPHLYALYTQHHPSEFQIELRDARGVLSPALTHEYKPKHEHDNAVTSVGIETPGELDPKKLNAWLGNLLRTQEPDIFRMKGILSIKGEDKRFVFQGVHMLFDGRPDCSWGNTPRRNSLIIIGRNLDRAALNEGFKACLTLRCLCTRQRWRGVAVKRDPTAAKSPSCPSVTIRSTSVTPRLRRSCKRQPHPSLHSSAQAHAKGSQALNTFLQSVTRL